MTEAVRQAEAAILDGIGSGTRKPRHRRPSASPNSLRTFLVQHVMTDRGPFSFVGYRPLRDICDVLAGSARTVDIVKPTQKGFTTAIGFGYTLWQAHRNDRNVGYFLPTNKLAEEILATRFRPAVRDSDLRSSIRETPSKGLVRVADRYAYFLGLEAVENAISRPFDLNIYDEVDDLNQDHLTIARQRLDASDFGREVAFACGRFPGEGIHGRYLLGDQRRWVVRCPACSVDQILEDDFPGNMAIVDGHWRTHCIACHRPVDGEAHGRFVAQRPDVRDRVSFQVSALAFGCTDLDRIMSEWDAAQRDRRELAAFRCSKLALPDAGDRQAILVEDISRVLRPHPLASPRFVGIDVGDICHVAMCGASTTSGGFEFVHFSAMRGEELVTILQALDSEMQFEGILIDQKPEGSLARAVCRAFPGRAWLQEFRAKETEELKELGDERFDRLVFEREETIEHFFDRIKSGHVWFPQQWEGAPFEKSAPGRHLLTGSQKEDKTDRHGIPVRKFRSGSVQNHYMMACVFADVVARRNVGLETAIHEVRISDSKRATAELGSTSRRSTSNLAEEFSA